jgi:hypothetical protein
MQLAKINYGYFRYYMLYHARSIYVRFICQQERQSFSVSVSRSFMRWGNTVLPTILTRIMSNNSSCIMRLNRSKYEENNFNILQLVNQLKIVEHFLTAVPRSQHLCPLYSRAGAPKLQCVPFQMLYALG